jgi:peroxiredoxin
MAEKTMAELLEESTERCRSLDGTLGERLKALADDVRGLSSDFADVVERMIQRLRDSGVGEKAPRVGEPMPEFMLPDQSGRLVTLSELLGRGPVVIAFHRGHWCPYCRVNAAGLASIEAGVRDKGASMVVIMPEVEKFAVELARDSDAHFPILSDMDNGYALMLNLAFYVGDEKRRYMKGAGWDISLFQGNSSWTLPIPATFVVGRDGLVVGRFIDPDYRKRMALDELMAAVTLSLS